METYCQMLIRMARNGYPYCYPEPQEACEDYSPICVPIEPVESPYEGMPGYDPEYPFVLTSGRVPYFHHGTMRHAPFSRELFPCAEIRTTRPAPRSSASSTWTGSRSPAAAARCMPAPT